VEEQRGSDAEPVTWSTDIREPNTEDLWCGERPRQGRAKNSLDIEAMDAIGLAFLFLKA